MCFIKRKRGLLKKAIELSKLTGARVLLTIITEDYKTATNYKSFNENAKSFIHQICTTESFGPELVRKFP